MKRTIILLSTLLVLGTMNAALADDVQKAAGDQASGKTAVGAPPKDESVVTHGSVTIGGKTIRYTATAGLLVIKNKDQKPIASMSYVAYVESDVRNPGTRPITFLYNGGPGSSTVWLHMLAFGPRRVVVGSGTLTPPAPYRMVNNNDSLLDASDLVFIDAPGTGFGRVIGKDQGGAGTDKDVYGVDQDAHAFAEFITRYLTLNSRWNSPKFLYGESYGTLRSAVLADLLETEDGVGLNGVILQSSILDYDIFPGIEQYNPGVNTTYILELPSYAATAWYHHKLPQQPADLQAFLRQVEQFATTDYAQALMQGSLLDSATERNVAERMHQYTGLPTAWILKDDLRVTGPQFAHELLGADDMVTGRLDSRYSGPAMDPMGQSPDYDPMSSAIGAPTVAEFNDYVRNTLDFGKDLTYKPQTDAISKWEFKHKQPYKSHALPIAPNVMPDLAAAMKYNPRLHVLLMGGYFDLGTPFYSSEYEMHQLPIPATLQQNISYRFFPSGHMVYLNPKAHDGLHAAAAAFINAHYRH